jgi:hypothetical protein
MATRTGRSPHALLTLVLAAALLAPALARAQSFTNLESGHVRPLALSPDGDTLFAVNTPDNRLEVFTVDADGLTHAGSVQVGLEPVAVAARSDSEVWVVNHLSDWISIVDVASSPPRAPCWSATSRATSCSRGRAATARSLPPRTAARTTRPARSSRARVSGAPTCGCSTR